MVSNLYDLRIKTNLSLNKLSKKTKISISHLQRIENNEVDPSVQKCMKLAKILNVTIEDLYSSSKEENEMIISLANKKAENEVLTNREMLQIYQNMDEQFKLLLTKSIKRYYKIIDGQKQSDRYK